MDIQSFWRKKLGKYSDTEWSKQPSYFVQEVEKYFPNNCSTLELGAGLGQDSKYLMDKGNNVLTTDISEFSKEMSTTEFKLVDMAIPLPFENESYDVIYSHLGIHYFDKERTVELFSEMRNILKVGGILALLVNSIDDPEIVKYQELEKDFYIDEDGLKKRFFSVKSLKEMLTGFEIILLNNLGISRKDEVKNVSGLIRLVARKS
jgi:SAM-dependent methyltransferase